MTPLVQNIIVFVLVAIAAAWLARLLWRTFNAKQNCGCGSRNGCAKISMTMSAKRAPASIPETAPAEDNPVPATHAPK